MSDKKSIYEDIIFLVNQLESICYDNNISFILNINNYADDYKTKFVLDL